MRLPVTLTLRRSRVLIALLVAAHMIVAAGLLATDMSVVGKLLLLSLLGLSLMATFRRSPITALVLGSRGSLMLVRSDGSQADGEVDQATAVFTWLVVLRIRMPERVESLALPVDALGVDGHRQLRLWLKWKASVSTV